MKTILALLFVSSFAIAAPKNRVKPQPVPTWYCFIAVDSNTQTVEACERTETACNEDIATHELDAEKVHCFGATKAVAFTIRHRNDGTRETLAVPEMAACQFFSQTIVNEDIDLIEVCKVVP